MARVAVQPSSSAVGSPSASGRVQVTTHALRSRRWRAFAEPATPEYDPEYCAQVRACLMGP